MNTKQITTESGIVLLLVDVKPAWYNFDIEDNRIYFWEKIEEQEHLDFRALPEGNWQGKHFKEMSEEEWIELSASLVINDGKDKMFKNYDKKSRSAEDWSWDFFTETAIQAGASLIRSNGFDPENTVVLTLKD